MGRPFMRFIFRFQGSDESLGKVKDGGGSQLRGNSRGSLLPDHWWVCPESCHLLVGQLSL